jgi:hypothetical protein
MDLRDFVLARLESDDDALAAVLIGLIEDWYYEYVSEHDYYGDYRENLLKRIAVVYSSHSDFREEWRP